MSLPSDPPGPESDGLFARAKAGDQSAWEALFQMCYPKVVRVVRRKLSRPLRSLCDSTDIASDVMKSLAANVDRLDFPSIDSLIAFLAQVAEQKVIDEHRRRHTHKRNVKIEQPIGGAGAAGGGEVAIASNDPTASEVAQAKEAEQQLLARKDETERTLIAMKQEGYSNSEIAERIRWNIRRVQRFFKDLQRSVVKSGGR